MSALILNQCDNCNSIAKEPSFEHKGWIHFDRFELRFSNGKAFNTKHLSNMDFCSVKCFQQWLNKL